MDATQKKKALLVFHSPGDQRVSVSSLPPLGILSVAASLEKKGIGCDVVDLTIEPTARIAPEPYDLIGFSVNISNLGPTLKAIEQIKSRFPEKPVVAGGSLCLSNPEALFKSKLDAVFNCEGEEALFEYMVNPSKESVEGVYLRNGDGFNYTGRRGWVQDLDAMPFPDFRKVDITKYNVFPKRRRPISSIMSSRGCPFGCIFCSHSMGRKWRPRSAENVVAEIEWQVNTIGVKEICVFDDNFSLDRERAVRICDLLLEKRIPVKLQFTNGLRADCLDPVLLAKLKRAGTWMIGLAPETGNREVMLKIKKGFDHTRVNLIRRECRKAGIKTFGFFMIGFPFETRREIKETVRYAQELDCEIVEFNKVIPHVKTELFDMIVQSGSLMQDPTSTTTSYHEGAISTHRVGDLSPEEVKRLIRHAYRSYYLRPRKMLDLLLTFSPADLGVLTLYALRTRNI